MKRQAGLTLVDLVVVVAVVGVAAAIGVPALVRARVAANESATIGDIRTVISAEAAYRSSNGGWYESVMSCLARNGGCIPMFPTSSPTFLDSQLASLVPRAGYTRAVPSLGASPTDVNVSPSSTSAYVYSARPVVPGETGVRGFGGDSSGLICYRADGGQVKSQAGRLVVDVVSCIVLE